ncbi:twin-arginine translocase TatA/TatE family subunit [bacterium]|nr:twin-arginine translocase TatA/TatE family subunit [bacterium]
MIGTTELILIVLVIVVLFGASAIPKFARSLGQAKAEFEKGFKQGKTEEKKESDTEKEAK